MSAGGAVGKGVGRLRARATLESPVREKRPGGQQQVTEWTTVGTYWAAVEPATAARELFPAAQQIAVGDYAVTIRGGPDVRHDWRVVVGGVALQVLALVRPLAGPANALVILCREQQPATAG